MPQPVSGKAVAEVLKAENVTHVFSLPGGEILPIYDALVAEGIKIITTRHEQAAGNAADGWARVTRTPGVCLVPMGPGIVNAVPALAQAYQMGSPIVAITSSIAHKLADMDAFEDLDLKADNKPIRLKEAKDKVEYQLICEALERNRGNISQTSKDLGVTRPTLHDMMKKHNISRQDFRPSSSQT